jgi:hypothetical protein
MHHAAVRRILAQRIGTAGLSIDGFERLSPHALRAGFTTEACNMGVRDKDIMRHTRHRGFRQLSRQRTLFRWQRPGYRPRRAGGTG